MPISKRRESRVIAAIYADVVGVGDKASDALLRPALERVNQIFAPAVAEPFATAGGSRVDGALSDPAQAPLCISVLRELLAPRELRVGVGIGTVENLRDAEGGRDPYSVARRALQLALRDRGLSRYLGTGEAGDVLLGALCRLVDPLIRARTPKQWEAIAAYRVLGHQRDVAEKLGVTRQSVGDRLAAGHRRAVEEADAAIATYLSYVRRQRLTP
ncbi:MAG: hypothetical protein WC709_01165 [Thermoleophilia bacterium]